VVQTAQDWPRHQPTADRSATGKGPLPAEASVWSVAVEVIRELG